ncbi:MAG: protein kinase [Isosphaeraceae bacterium]|nr:protein kinase [Isosphaeraceae bacterium]
MLGKLFGSENPSGSKPRRGRVNLDRRFTVLALTSQGSMSRVQKALDKEMGRTVCLKVQLRDKNEAAVARASREAQRPDEGAIASQIVHPNVCRTFDYGESTRGEHFLVMEFVDGVSLQFVREALGASLVRKLDLLTQAAEGLEAVHKAGFIHHDINPHNFLVDREDRVKLIDFGLAVPNTPAFRRPGNRTGTLQYMAPELIRREPTDERLDIFAFGAVAFEFLTGRLPYDSGTGSNNSLAMILQRINHDPLDPAVAAPGLPPEVCAILRKAIARRKDDRYASMADLIHDLRALPPELCGASAASAEACPLDEELAAIGEEPAGGVYMLKAGPLYLIKKTSQFDRRLAKVRQLSDKVEVIHTIPSPNPGQAEAYWHERFARKRQKEAWFALTEHDVAEFKAHEAMASGGE